MLLVLLLAQPLFSSVSTGFTLGWKHGGVAGDTVFGAMDAQSGPLLFHAQSDGSGEIDLALDACLGKSDHFDHSAEFSAQFLDTGGGFTALSWSAGARAWLGPLSFSTRAGVQTSLAWSGYSSTTLWALAPLFEFSLSLDFDSLSFDLYTTMMDRMNRKWRPTLVTGARLEAEIGNLSLSAGVFAELAEVFMDNFTTVSSYGAYAGFTIGDSV